MVKHGVMHYMSRDKLHIIDYLFSHTYSSSWYNKPTLFDWDRTHNDDHVILTDKSLDLVSSVSSKKKYAWLVESPMITPNAYDFIRKNYDKFDLIFTFDKNLLGLSHKFVLLPIGGCWIEENDRIIHDKTKLIGITLSAKKITEGHRLRHDIVNTNLINNLDVFGFNNPIQNKIIGLKEYKFNLIIENAREDYYFTEKLIDCFITGTIPVYWGCPSIHEFFDIKGIITFSSLDELNKKKNLIDDEFYKNNYQSVLKNYDIAKKYLVADDIIYKILKK
jgi:hypothetical protein